ncbi:MAG: GNAT family N-acetyltransferase [Planctomycetes bacterium]|nr:GNAT family N-acetyltransferase [Planctomycetota bacterium]MBI3835331.1 GNAT family N-acetyltransferase [Planctomycetota bacterium]
MATAKVIPVGPSELALISELYNEVFSPKESVEYFQRRFRGRYNVAMMVAMVDDRPVGFIIGFELMPTTFFSWICGVLPDFRRQGISTQLIQAQHAWAGDHGYQLMRFECNNQHRPMLHVAITEGYDLVGIRYDSSSADNVVIFEKELP